jgi:hypothetical protein
VSHAKSPAKRTYTKHGLSSLQNALKAVSGTEREHWLQSLGDVGHELQLWQDAITADLGGETSISAMEQAIIEMATKTYLLLSSIDRFLLEQPSLVNKCKRQLFPVVLQRQQLADALARYMSQLGLKRRAKPAPSLHDYLSQRGQTDTAAKPVPDQNHGRPDPDADGGW